MSFVGVVDFQMDGVHVNDERRDFWNRTTISPVQQKLEQKTSHARYVFLISSLTLRTFPLIDALYPIFILSFSTTSAWVIVNMWYPINIRGSQHYVNLHLSWRKLCPAFEMQVQLYVLLPILLLHELVIQQSNSVSLLPNGMIPVNFQFSFPLFFYCYMISFQEYVFIGLYMCSLQLIFLFYLLL